MKKSLVIAFLLLLSTTINAQGELLVRHNEKGLYLEHSVAAKETFYSLGRTYHLNPKEIAAFNSLDMAKGLQVGQKLFIPLSSANFSQTSGTGKPVYYVVGPSEGLYRVSQNNNNVLMASLRKWNKLSGDQVSAGQKLIVGYLQAGESAPLVSNEKKPATEEKKPVIEQKPVDTPPVKKEPEEVRPEPQKPVEKKPEPQAPRPEPAVNRTTTPPPAVTASMGNGGYFRALYEQQIKSYPPKVDETATAGIFKTSSGWQDGKFYALAENVEQGTIVKVVNPANGKVVYAKVLGPMSGIRQNQGYDLRISNAAASALEISDTDKFIVRIAH